MALSFQCDKFKLVIFIFGHVIFVFRPVSTILINSKHVIFKVVTPEILAQALSFWYDNFKLVIFKVCSQMYWFSFGLVEHYFLQIYMIICNFKNKVNLGTQCFSFDVVENSSRQCRCDLPWLRLHAMQYKIVCM